MTHSTMPESSGVTLTGKGEAYAAIHSLRPAGCPLGVHPREWREAIAARIEEHQDAITALVEVLDGATPDADFEPTLGAPEAKVGGYVPPEARQRPGDQTHWADGHCDDGENEANEDDEPSLCGPSEYVNGRYEVDLELDRCDDEPSLACTEADMREGRLVAYPYSHDPDLELDPCDKGEPDLDSEPRVPTVVHPNGSYIAGGGSGI